MGGVITVSGDTYYIMFLKRFLIIPFGYTPLPQVPHKLFGTINEIGNHIKSNKYDIALESLGNSDMMAWVMNYIYFWHDHY